MKKAVLVTFLISSFIFSQTKTDTLDLSEHPNMFTLSSRINETSGVEFYNDHLYTFNDSGGNPEIYKLSAEDGSISQTIKIKNARNVDWEEIARKGDTLFIGDFGNNLGIRRDLTIYSIVLPKSNFPEKTKADILNVIHFNFEDQTDFENRGYARTNFDCEALIYYKGKLHLFSKCWGSNQTVHYELYLQPSKDIMIAKKIETFNTECVITGADIHNDELYLIGYTWDGVAYVWKFSDFSKGMFFNGKAQKTLIGLSAAIGQTEGIAVTDDKIYITGEEIKHSFFHREPALYILDKSEWK
ncbi:MAG: hypothetical protein LBP34_07225 [Flavobacteriaceae bacterium]|jgi:hypothetical protein|nr:hypothetical protein [Flavobacteriaceae bacterium]